MLMGKYAAKAGAPPATDGVAEVHSRMEVGLTPLQCKHRRQLPQDADYRSVLPDEVEPDSDMDSEYKAWLKNSSYHAA